MANTLICCGGTGAHVALALMRLHALGHPLGYFRRESDERALALPTIYLVDQDDGDAVRDGETAWQKLRSVIKNHPSRSEWSNSAGTAREPEQKSVTPLPIGVNKDWFDAPHHCLRLRFADSPFLDLIASAPQQDIRYSHGMMGSPAIGSLLFKLKQYDRRNAEFNHDRDFHDLLELGGRVAVVGSAVGGTGSSVAPTLATMLAEDGHSDVMAVMVLEWFRLRSAPGADRNEVRSTKARNRDMGENASSGLRYYGQRLARKATTVPLGVPREGIVDRTYTGDNQQPLHEAYPHAAAALCCMRHYLASRPYGRGLYHLSGGDCTKLDGGMEVAGGTLQSMANLGVVLKRTADAVGTTLIASGKVSRHSPKICREVHKITPELDAVGRALKELADVYGDHLHWLTGAFPPSDAKRGRGLGVANQDPRGWTMERDVAGRLLHVPLTANRSDRPQDVAGKLFQWTADWIRDEAARRDSKLLPATGAVGGVYWPPMRKEGLAAAPGTPGTLVAFPRQNINALLDAFVHPTNVTQNGWPEPFAVVGQFEDAIRQHQQNPVSMRKLEILLAGYVGGELTIREVGSGTPEGVTIDRLVKEMRLDSGESLAQYELVYEAGDRTTKVAFTAPGTVFCPVPGVPDETWAQLWSALTGYAKRAWKPGSAESWEQARWGPADHSARKAVAWINACRRMWPSAERPPWTYAFPSVRRAHDDAQPEVFGSGTELRIRWGQDLVPVFLPTWERSAIDWPPSDIPLEEDPSRFLEQHGRIEDERGTILYEVVENLNLPVDPGSPSGSAQTPGVRGIWKEHLDLLKARGAIATFGESRADETVYVVIQTPDRVERKCIVLTNTRILERKRIQIDHVVPLLQDPPPLNSTAQGSARHILYPDLPLRSDYVGLASEGRQPEFERLASGNFAVWRLQLRGRGGTVNIGVRLREAEGDHRAHWMVWPNFTTTGPHPWRAYYVYAHSTHARIGVDVLYHDPDGGEALLVRRGDERSTSYPVAYDLNDRIHTGGPPAAVLLRDRESNEELGMYTVQLDELDPLTEQVSIGIDFGTSHSTAAVAIGDINNEVRHQLLSPDSRREGAVELSHHISWNRDHAENGLVARSAWMPTYVPGTSPSRPMLPTELITIVPVDKLTAAGVGKDVERWVPMRDYYLPPPEAIREKFAEHVITNFKWDTVGDFIGREASLRKVYLERLVELVLAEVLRKYGEPRNGVSFTFTYPLRTLRDDLEEFRHMLADVLKRATRSLGVDLSLTDGYGLYNESHAARVGTATFPEVRVVADLGGGTLDLFISSQSTSFAHFREVVDSVKIGGNLLIDALAGQLARRMPSGWSTDRRKLAIELAAWMRSVGSRKLFGRAEGGTPELESLNLRGFQGRAEKAVGLELIHRYFYLVGEYLSRSVSAYLATHWYRVAKERDHGDLSVDLYLRGNGWRLWPGQEDYAGIQKIMAQRVTSRVAAFWQDFRGIGWTVPREAPNCGAGETHGDPKLDIVRNVVGRARDDDVIRENWLSYALVELQLLDGSGTQSNPWHSEIPFRTGGKGTKVQIQEISPALPLHAEGSTIRHEIGRPQPGDGLGRVLRKVNDQLVDDVDYVGRDNHDLRAPVAAWVWEAAFHSDAFRKGS